MEETLISCTLSAHSHCEDRLTFSFEFTGHSVSITYARCVADHCQIPKPLEDFSLQSVSFPRVLKECICIFVCVKCLKATVETLATFSHKMSETCTSCCIQANLRVYKYGFTGL